MVRLARIVWAPADLWVGWSIVAMLAIAYASPFWLCLLSAGDAALLAAGVLVVLFAARLVPAWSETRWLTADELLALHEGGDRCRR